jgi:16S rRNA (adenine1518-N6/adenine1519-N6)-dimethyltransferase
LGLTRRGPGADARLRELVHGAFAHRRKTAAGALALAGGYDAAARERVRTAMVELGHPPDERAERLGPEEFRELARRLHGLDG